MVIVTDPGSGRDKRYSCYSNSYDAPSQDNLGCVESYMVLEPTHEDEDEPGKTRGSATGMYTADVL